MHFSLSFSLFHYLSFSHPLLSLFHRAYASFYTLHHTAKYLTAKRAQQLAQDYYGSRQRIVAAAATAFTSSSLASAEKACVPYYTPDSTYTPVCVCVCVREVRLCIARRPLECSIMATLERYPTNEGCACSVIKPRYNAAGCLRCGARATI